MKKINISLLCLFLLFACEEAETISPSTYACQLSLAVNPSDHPDAGAFQAALEKMDAYTTGVQVALTSADGQTWTGASGMADIPNNVPFDPCTKTMVGSISKTFTGVLILQLQDEGVLNVSDPVSKWLDESLIGEIDNADEVNLVHLLTHTSGIRDYLGIEQYINALNTPFFQETQAEKLKYVYGKKAYHAPGERYTYSNTNYVMLGLIIEKARNMSLWGALDTYIFEPLGMENSVMGTHDMPIPPGTARPYRYIRNNKFEDMMHIAVSDAATGDGGIASSTQDMLIFIEALFSGKIMSEAAFQQMTDLELVLTGEDEADFPSWPNEGYGLGISRWNTPLGTAYGHTGSTSTYSAYLFHFPEKKVSLAIAYNGTGKSGFGTKQRALRETLFSLLLE